MASLLSPTTLGVEARSLQDYHDEHLLRRWIGQVTDYSMSLTQWPLRNGQADAKPSVFSSHKQARKFLCGDDEEESNDEEYNSKYDSSTEIDPGLDMDNGHLIRYNRVSPLLLVDMCEDPLGSHFENENDFESKNQ
ncbi:hypothetical protein TNCV_2728661 [Trichonephila clavipes]|nr:hypothetical protein TNCV_2728661 [Trichonephila clavipes]